jgi:hypothetical protein
MKATLTFDLPDERVEFALAQKGQAYYCAMCALDERLRGLVKYPSDTLSNEYVEGLAYARTLLHDVLSDEGLSLEEPR